MTARQLPAHALKALTVRVSLALTFDVPDWPTQVTEREYDDCVHVRDALLLCANRAESLPDDKETPEEFLPKVIDAARKLCDQVESDEVVRRLKAFQKELQKQYKGQAVVSVQHVLDSVTEAVTQWVHSAHGSAAAPALVIHTVQVDADASDGMLRKFCVSAQHSVADDDTSLASEVTVRFKQKAFCWEALCQLPYVLTHELVCHVFQGMAGDTRRTTASPCCAWSEGWMDTLAYGIYSRLCHRSVKQPSWWISEAERVHRNGTEHGILLEVSQTTSDLADSRQRAVPQPMLHQQFPLEVVGLRLKSVEQNRRTQGRRTQGDGGGTACPEKGVIKITGHRFDRA